MRFGSAALSLLFVACAGCQGAHDVTEPAGAMSHSGCDGSGRLVATGWIRLEIEPIAVPPIPRELAGTWNLHALADAASIDPQNGFGVRSGGSPLRAFEPKGRFAPRSDARDHVVSPSQ